MPLYVDGVPSAPLRIMELLEKSGKAAGKKIYIVANISLYESMQIPISLRGARMSSTRTTADHWMQRRMA